MNCPLCGHVKAHKHGKMPNGHQRYLCPACDQTFSESFDSLYYRRHVSPEQIRASSTSASAKAVAYEELVGQLDLLTTPPLSIVRAARAKAQIVHNAEVQAVQTIEVSADEMWSFVSKNKNSVAPKN